MIPFNCGETFDNSMATTKQGWWRGYCYDWNSKKNPAAIDICSDNGFRPNGTLTALRPGLSIKTLLTKWVVFTLAKGLNSITSVALLTKTSFIVMERPFADVSKCSKMDHSVRGLNQKPTPKNSEKESLEIPTKL